MRYILILISINFLISCQSNQQSGGTTDTEGCYQLVSATEFSDLITQDKDAQLIDVRTLDEVKQGYIEGALNLDFYQDHFKDQLTDLDKSKKVYVYCQSGKRSNDAARMLEQLGYCGVVELKGGYSAWEDEGRKVVK